MFSHLGQIAVRDGYPFRLQVTCTVLFQIPNQPIVFADDPSQRQRSEDALIAWTWHHFITINSSEPYWLARLPMTKVSFARAFMLYHDQ